MKIFTLLSIFSIALIVSAQLPDNPATQYFIDFPLSGYFSISSQNSGLINAMEPMCECEEKFHVINLGNGYYTITTVDTNLALTYNDIDDVFLAAPVSENLYQQFELVFRFDNVHTIVPRLFPTKAIEGSDELGGTPFLADKDDFSGKQMPAFEHFLWNCLEH